MAERQDRIRIIEAFENDDMDYIHVAETLGITLSNAEVIVLLI